MEFENVSLKLQIGIWKDTCISVGLNVFLKLFGTISNETFSNFENAHKGIFYIETLGIFWEYDILYHTKVTKILVWHKNDIIYDMFC